MRKQEPLLKKDDKIEMDFIEKITLSPFEKYVRFERFPWKFICHLLLIVLTTYQSLKIVSIQDKHTRIQEEVFSTVYLQSEDGSSSFPFYSLSDFSDSFFGVMDQTRSLNESLLQYSNIEDVQYRLEVYYSEVSVQKTDRMVFEGNEEEFVAELQSIPLHEGEYGEMKEFLQEVENLKLRISNVITYISVDEHNRFDSCLNWTIDIEYSFESFANIDSNLEANSLTCRIDEERVTEEESLLGVHLAVLLVSSCSLALAWKQVYTVSKDYMGYKRGVGHGGGKEGREGEAAELEESRMRTHVDWNKNWEELGFLEKLKFFDFWFLVIVAGNFFQLFGAFVAVLDSFIVTDLIIFQHKEVLIGFGVMLAWVTILKYLEYSNNLNLMTSTLSKSWGNLFMFLLGVMPFFLGFVFLGQTLFWKYNKFEDTSSSVVTLFSLLNGDIVNDTFLETWAEGLPGQIYLIVFMVLFYTAVQNVFVTIIMEGYEESIKEREYKKMLEEKESEDKHNFEKNLEQIEKESFEHPEFVDDKLVPPEGEQRDIAASLTPEQSAGISRVRRNGKKVDLILDELKKIHAQINESELNGNQKSYLNKLIKDNLESASRTIKLQVKELKE